MLVIEGNQNVAKVREFLAKEGLDSGGGPAQTGMFKPGRMEGSIDLAVLKTLAKNKPTA